MRSLLHLFPFDLACKSLELSIHSTSPQSYRRVLGRRLIDPQSPHAKHVSRIHMTIRLYPDGRGIVRFVGRPQNRGTLNGKPMVPNQDYPLRDGDLLCLLEMTQSYIYRCGYAQLPDAEQSQREPQRVIFLGKRKAEASVHQRLLQQVRAMVECAVCLDTFTQPCTLTCGHTLCLACAEALPKQRCPTCDAPFEPASLHVNYSLAQLLSSL